MFNIIESFYYRKSTKELLEEAKRGLFSVVVFLFNFLLFSMNLQNELEDVKRRIEAKETLNNNNKEEASFSK